MSWNEGPQVLLATGNEHKVRELRRLLEGLALSFPSPGDLRLVLTVEEDGVTYEENALKKARAAAAASGLHAMADDSGIEVEALDGGPGVYTARFAGPDATDGANNALLLERLEGVPPSGRRARYVCVAVLVSPSGVQIAACRGEWEGVIATRPSGGEGFGFDPLFVIQSEGKTVADLGDAFKGKHSHRSRAFRQLIPYLRTLEAGPG